MYSEDVSGTGVDSFNLPAGLGLAPGVYQARLRQGGDVGEVRFVRLR
jgi:hypothetical protein